MGLIFFAIVCSHIAMKTYQSSEQVAVSMLLDMQFLLSISIVVGFREGKFQIIHFPPISIPEMSCKQSGHNSLSGLGSHPKDLNSHETVP